jgi:hypothetical protein
MSAPNNNDNSNSRSNEGREQEEDRRMRMRSFLYVVRHDLSHIRTDLRRLLDLNREYLENGSHDFRWARVKEHSTNALTNLRERRNYILRNLGEIADLTRGDPSLEPQGFVLLIVDPCGDVFHLASEEIQSHKFEQPERERMVTDASTEIDRLDSEIQRLDDLIRSSS